MWENVFVILLCCGGICGSIWGYIYFYLQRDDAKLQVAAAKALGRVGSTAAVMPLEEAVERSPLEDRGGQLSLPDEKHSESWKWE